MRPEIKIVDLKNLVEKAKRDLSIIGEIDLPIPELINTTNLLRNNEFLQQKNEKKSLLMNAYAVYTAGLENLLSIYKIKLELTSLKSTPQARTHSKRKPRIKRKKNSKNPSRTKRRKKIQKPKKRKT